MADTILADLHVCLHADQPVNSALVCLILYKSGRLLTLMSIRKMSKREREDYIVTWLTTKRNEANMV